MTTTELPLATRASANRTGLYLSFLQLAFTLLWTVYVIYLPKLAAQVGIASAGVILILMLDQAIFTLTDTMMGMIADKVKALVGRLGVFVGALTLLSCAAFAALPFVAGMGPAARIGLMALIAIWAVTSSALRAPALILLGKYRATPRLPFLAALVMQLRQAALWDGEQKVTFIWQTGVILTGRGIFAQGQGRCDTKTTEISGYALTRGRIHQGSAVLMHRPEHFSVDGAYAADHDRRQGILAISPQPAPPAKLAHISLIFSQSPMQLVANATSQIVRP